MPRREGGWLKDHGLTISLFALFGCFLIGQALTGWRTYNVDGADHGRTPLTFGSYVTTGHFVEATFENWESEFLQMGAYVVLTVWLIQRGSAESRSPDRSQDGSDQDAGGDRPGPVVKGGWRLKLYENSLGIAFAVLFVASFTLHAVGGAHAFSAEQVEHGHAPIGTATFVRTSEFWFQSFQNWQSEFVAVGSIVVLSIYLRQKGSPQSKQVSAPHDRTGT